MSVHLPPSEVSLEPSRAAELHALRHAHALATELEIDELELSEQFRSLSRRVDHSMRFASRNVVDDEALQSLVDAAKRVAVLERELLVTRQAQRRVAAEIATRARRLMGGRS